MIGVEAHPTSLLHNSMYIQANNYSDSTEEVFNHLENIHEPGNLTNSTNKDFTISRSQDAKCAVYLHCENKASTNPGGLLGDTQLRLSYPTPTSGNGNVNWHTESSTCSVYYIGIPYRHRAHLNTLRQGPRHLPHNQNNQLKLHLQPLNAIITACDFKPAKYTPGVVPRPNLGPQFGKEKHISVQTGPLQEPQARALIKARGKFSSTTNTNTTPLNINSVDLPSRFQPPRGINP